MYRHQVEIVAKPDVDCSLLERRSFTVTARQKHDYAVSQLQPNPSTMYFAFAQFRFPVVARCIRFLPRPNQFYYRLRYFFAFRRMLGRRLHRARRC